MSPVGGRRGCLPKSPPEHLTDGRGLEQDLPVGEAEDLDSLTGEERVAPAVARGLTPLEVLSAVCFHGEAKLWAEEVENVRPSRVLPTELRSESPVAQDVPEPLLGVRGTEPKAAAELEGPHFHLGTIHAGYDAAPLTLPLSPRQKAAGGEIL